jgi:hypothetical protein
MRWDGCRGVAAQAIVAMAAVEGLPGGNMQPKAEAKAKAGEKSAYALYSEWLQPDIERKGCPERTVPPLWSIRLLVAHSAPFHWPQMRYMGLLWRFLCHIGSRCLI